MLPVILMIVLIAGYAGYIEKNTATTYVAICICTSLVNVPIQTWLAGLPGLGVSLVLATGVVFVVTIAVTRREKR